MDNPSNLTPTTLSLFLIPYKISICWDFNPVILANLTLKKCSKAVKGRLMHALLNCPLDVTGVVGYKKAEVTAGGIDLNEVKAATMESKIVPGLYFAGEIMDIDGRIGGFNFQWAWSTGTIAGRSVVKNLA